MESKHTPGPWEHQGLSIIHVEPMSNDETLTTLVASCYTCAFENGAQDANAALIAAAPDMYEALRALFDECVMVTRYAGDASRLAALAAIEAARAALAKAEGR